VVIQDSKFKIQNPDSVCRGLDFEFNGDGTDAKPYNRLFSILNFES